jgi:hypothetical protein
VVIVVVPSDFPQKSNGNLNRELFEEAGITVAEAVTRSPRTAVPTTEPGANARSKSFFERAIAAEWHKQVPSIIETGRWVLEAQEELDRDVFKTMRMPFSERTAQALKRIAKHPVLSNPAHHGALPACWRTLDELIRQADGNDELLEAALANGRIRPDLQRKNIREALGLPPKPSRGGSKGSGKGDELPPDPVAIWATLKKVDKEKILGSEGRTGLAKLVPTEMMSDLADHAIRQQVVWASTKIRPAITFTAILRTALDPATTDAGAVIARFNARLESLGLDLHDISVAVRMKGQGKRGEKH